MGPSSQWPVGKVLQAVLHVVRTQGPCQVEQPAEEIAQGTLLRDDQAGMVQSLAHPLMMESGEVADVERQQDAALLRGPGQLRGIKLAETPGFRRRDRVESRGAQVDGDLAV